MVQEEFLAKLPPNIPLNTAGGIPLASLTAWQALHEGNPQPSKRVLVFAAAGGVGTFAVQIAKALGMYVVSKLRVRPEPTSRQSRSVNIPLLHAPLPNCMFQLYML